MNNEETPTQKNVSGNPAVIGSNRAIETPISTSHGGEVVRGHAKELCVNKLGHTLITPPLEKEKIGFCELFMNSRLQTITYCAVFWSFGMCVAFLGPTLLDLECRVSSVFSAMSWVFFSQSLFTLIGSAFGGFFVERLGNHIVLLISTTMLCVTLAVIPFCRVLGWLTFVLAVMGFFMGSIDTVANISMIHLYGRNVAPFLQALHFFYGLGAFLSPMIAEPFLLNKDCTTMILNSTLNRHQIPSSANLSGTMANRHDVSHNSRIEYAFWILSGLQAPVILLLVILNFDDFFSWNKQKEEIDIPPVIPNAEKEQGMTQFSMETTAGHKTGAGNVRKDESDRPSVSGEQVVLVALCTAALLYIYDGLQSSYGGYIFSYGVKSIAGMTMNEAAYLNACFWGTFAFGRLVSIGIATKLAPSVMLVFNIGGCMTAMIIMLCFRHSHGVLYLGTGLFGVFLSSVFPTAVSLAEMYISVTSSITSVFVVCAAAGEMMLPVVVGHEFHAQGPAALLVTGVIATAISFVVYLVLCFVGDTITRQSSERNLISRLKQIIRRSPKEENEDSGLLKHHVKFYSRMRSDLSDSSLVRATTEASGSAGPTLL